MLEDVGKVELKQTLKLDFPALQPYFPNSVANVIGLVNKDNYNPILQYWNPENPNDKNLFIGIPLDMLSKAISDMPPEISNDFKKALIDAGIKIKELTQEEKANIATKSSRIDNYNRNHPQPRNIGKFVPSDTEVIYQREIGILDKNSDRSVLATISAGPCVIVGFFAKKADGNNEIALTHLTTLTDVERAIRFMYIILSTKKTESIEIHLCGGRLNSTDTQHLILDTINDIEKRDGNVHIKSVNLNNINNTGDMQLAIDTDGKIYTDFHRTQINNYDEFDRISLEEATTKLDRKTNQVKIFDKRSYMVSPSKKR